MPLRYDWPQFERFNRNADPVKRLHLDVCQGTQISAMGLKPPSNASAPLWVVPFRQALIASLHFCTLRIATIEQSEVILGARGPKDVHIVVVG
ncbi:hypothetical protein GGD81_003196 [Rhodobium orientis]|nr:hypothetical protein [Rhodobium orientis]